MKKDIVSEVTGRDSSYKPPSMPSPAPVMEVSREQF